MDIKNKKNYTYIIKKIYKGVKITKTRTILLIYFLFISYFYLFSDNLTIKIATEDYAPYISPSLEDNGLLAQIITEAFQRQNIRVIFSFLPAARGFLLAQNGVFDATIPWPKRDSHLEYFYYSEPIIERDKEVFLYLKDKKFNWDPEKQNYNKLSGLRIGAIIGTNYGDKFMEAEKNKTINVLRVTGTEQNIKMLLSKRINLLITPEKMANYILLKDFKEEERKSITRTLAIKKEPEYDYLIISKSSKNGEIFLEALNKGLIEMKNNGTYLKLINEFNQKYEK